MFEYVKDALPNYSLQPVYWQFEIGVAIVFRGWHVARTHVDLHGRYDQARHAEAGITRLPEGDKIFHAPVCADMHIAAFLIAYSAFPSIGFATRCLVIVANKDARCIRQGRNTLNRRVHHSGRATGKIAARGAEIWHEQRIADESRIADHVGQSGKPGVWPGVCKTSPRN